MNIGDVIWVYKQGHYPRGPYTIESINGVWVHLNVKPAAMKTEVFSSKLEAWQAYRQPIASTLKRIDAQISRMQNGEPDCEQADGTNHSA